MPFDAYAKQVRYHMESARLRLGCTKHTLKVDAIFTELLTNMLSITAREMINHHYCLELSKDKNRAPVLKANGKVLGVVESLRTMEQAAYIVLFPHFVCQDNLKVRMKKFIPCGENIDVFEVLSIFCDLSEALDEAKTDDTIWLIVITAFSAFIPYVQSTEALSTWPKMLRNAKSHGQTKMAGPVLSAFNMTKEKVRNWTINIEVDILNAVLLRMFDSLVKHLDMDVSHNAKDSTLWVKAK